LAIKLIDTILVEPKGKAAYGRE